MPIQKEITATATVSMLIIPVPRLSITHLDVSFLPTLTSWREVHQVNDVAVPDLQRGWGSKVLPAFPRGLTPPEFGRLEAILQTYLRGRVARVHPITWKQYEARLEGFATKSRALLDEFDDLGPAYTLAWSKITQTSETERRLSRDDIYPLISALHGASAHALEDARERRENGLKGDPAGPWIFLVLRLSDLFEEVGGKATAPKGRRGGGYADPSPFVSLIWTVMSEAIPPELREHDHSEGAMASAISDAFLKRHNADLWRGDPLAFVVE